MVDPDNKVLSDSFISDTMVGPDNKAKVEKLRKQGMYIAIFAVAVMAAVAAYSLKQQVYGSANMMQQASGSASSALYSKLSSSKTMPIKEFSNLTTGGLGNMSELNVSYAGAVHANMLSGGMQVNLNIPLIISIAKFKNSTVNITRLYLSMKSIPVLGNMSMIIVKNGTNTYVCSNSSLLNSGLSVGSSAGASLGYQCQQSTSTSSNLNISSVINSTVANSIKLEISNVKEVSYKGNSAVEVAGLINANLSSLSSLNSQSSVLGSSQIPNITINYTMNVSPLYHIPYSVYMKFNIPKIPNSSVSFNDLYIILNETSMSTSTSASIAKLPANVSSPASYGTPGMLGTTCVSNSGYLCANPVYSGATGNLTVGVGQDTNPTWYGTVFGFEPASSGINSAGLPNVVYWNASEEVTPLNLSMGQEQTVVIPISAPNTPLGSTNSAGYLWVAYSPTNSSTPCVSNVGVVRSGCIEQQYASVTLSAK
ncbi:MAG: hypothetical protein ACP5RP_03455 [Candidatus Micrarchaeia archaeon]